MLNRMAASMALVMSCAIPVARTAEAVDYKIDVTHSDVNFQVRSLGLFTYGGRFHQFTGAVALDPSHWESLQLKLQIPVDSLESRPAIWRSALLGSKFFDAAHHPTITFNAMKAARTGDASAQANGNLTIRGTTRPLKLSIRAAPDGGAFDITTETKLKRSDFGLGGMLPFTSDDVEVMLRLRIVPQSSRH